MVSFQSEGEKPFWDRWSARVRATNATAAGWRTLEVLLVALLAAGPLSAQSNTGELRLKLTDPSGLGVQSNVELTSDSNQVRQTVATDDAGNAVAKRLPFGGLTRFASRRLGSYRLRSRLRYDRPFPTPIRVQLTLAAVNASVVVKSADTLIDPHRVGDSNRIGSSTIQDRETSIPGRSVVDLVNSQPGWLYEGNAAIPLGTVGWQRNDRAGKRTRPCWSKT